MLGQKSNVDRLHTLVENAKKSKNTDSRLKILNEAMVLLRVIEDEKITHRRDSFANLSDKLGSIINTESNDRIIDMATKLRTGTERIARTLTVIE